MTGPDLATRGLRRTVTLRGGVVVPYPEPANATATRIGRANRSKDTKAEVKLRSALHRRGLRFRKDHLVRCTSLRVRPDVVFTRALVAVFVDGCFWHGCNDHQRVPRRNPEYWIPKLRANVARDRLVDEALRQEGWWVERTWEHEAPDEVAKRIELLVRGRTARADQARRS